MEPGHEDREYVVLVGRRPGQREASMEPGHEDREYLLWARLHPADMAASMEPGHEDREYDQAGAFPTPDIACLNGARS